MIRNFSIRRQQGGQSSILSRGLQVRTAQDKQPVISGYGGVYYDGTDGTQYELFQGYFEQIQEGAFARVVSESMDVRCLNNHSWIEILARTKAGSLSLSVDKVGLFYSFETVADNQRHQQVLQDIQSGLIDGSSIGFIADSVIWKDERQADGSWLSFRIIEDLTLFETSICSLPAYEATSVTATRSKGQQPQPDDSWVQSLIQEARSENRANL